MVVWSPPQPEKVNTIVSARTRMPNGSFDLACGEMQKQPLFSSRIFSVRAIIDSLSGWLRFFSVAGQWGKNANATGCHGTVVHASIRATAPRHGLLRDRPYTLIVKKAKPPGPVAQLGSIMCVKFSHQIQAVCFHRLEAYGQQLCDISVPLSLCDQL